MLETCLKLFTINKLGIKSTFKFQNVRKISFNLNVSFFLYINQMNLHRQVHAHVCEHVRAHTQYIWVTMADGERVQLILVPRKKKTH